MAPPSPSLPTAGGQARINREAFLDEVYNTRLYYLDDLVVGLFGRNFSGCENSICACNSGARQVANPIGLVSSAGPEHAVLA